MKQVSILVLLLSTILLSATIYVSDSFEITMRRSPANGSKIVKMLTSGNKLTVLKRGNGWIQVRDKNSGKAGWVLERYTMKEIPAPVKIATLTKKQEELETTLDSTNKFYADMKLNYNRSDSLMKLAQSEKDEYQNRYDVLIKDNLRMGGIIAGIFLIVGYILAFFPSPSKKKKRRY